MAVPALVILPVSPDGTKAITIGLSAEPSSPAAAVGAPSILVQSAGGMVAVAVGAAATSVAVATGASVGTSVGAGAGVAGVPQAESTITPTTVTTNRIYIRRLLLIFFSPLNEKQGFWQSYYNKII